MFRKKKPEKATKVTNPDGEEIVINEDSGRAKITFKYCTSTGAAEFEVDAKNMSQCMALTEVYMLKFYDLYMLKIIDVMQKTSKEMEKMLKTTAAAAMTQNIQDRAEKQAASCQSCKGGEEAGVSHKPIDKDDPSVA